MSIDIKPISISLNPNVEKDDIRLALKLIFRPLKWKRGEAIAELENTFREYFGAKYAFAFNSGRSSLFAILKSLNIKEGGDIMLQAFTCNAASNPIIWSGLNPIYVDCREDNFNIDVEDLGKKITSKTRAVIVQHTFGILANLEEIKSFTKEKNLILIEDCAHSLGAEHKEQKIGTFGDIAFFSFSRDKIISSVYGGMVITNNDNLAQKIKEIKKELKIPSRCWILQQLLHPVLMSCLILPSYKIFGKYLLVIFQKTKILSKAVHWKEKRGLMPSYFPKKMPNSLAILALNQFKKLQRFNAHRKEIAGFYAKELKNSEFDYYENGDSVFLRFAVKHKKAHEIIKKAWRNNLLIGDWYTSPVAPNDTKLEKIKYILGSCPKAEKLSKITFNIPTHINISKEQAQKIVNFLKKY